jgi:chromosome segregation ATPase
MNKALKISDVEDSSVALNTTDNAKVSNLTNLDADAIRAKIKAARLEKLMARQLESELSFELDTDIAPSIADVEIEATEEVAPLKAEAPVELEIPASKARGYSAGSSKRMRNIQSTRHSCDEMVTRIRSGSDILTGLNEQTTNLVKQLQFMEQEFARFEEAESKAARLASDHKRVTGEYEEALNLIEKQNRQLDVLEAQRANSNANYETTKAELEKLQREHQREAELFAESQMVNSELEQDNRSLTSKLSTAEANIAETTSELNATNNALKQKDMEAARAHAELSSARERLMNAETSLDTTSQELEKLSKDFTNKEIELQTTESSLAAASEKLAAAEQNLERTSKELENLTTEAHEKEMLCAKLTSDYSSLIKANTKVMSDLDNIQTKYDELNKSALEQQSQQYGRIHELESVLRDTKRQLELKTKANAELSVELEATNNLLVLHEEMVAALSPDERR